MRAMRANNTQKPRRNPESTPLALGTPSKFIYNFLMTYVTQDKLIEIIICNYNIKKMVSIVFIIENKHGIKASLKE